MIFVGVDWAEAHNDVLVMDEGGVVLGRGRCATGASGLAQLHALVADHAEEPVQVIIGIEIDRGLLVDSLTAAGYRVYGVNPLAASRYRDRHTTSAERARAETAANPGGSGGPIEAGYAARLGIDAIPRKDDCARTLDKTETAVRNQWAQATVQRS